MATIQNLIEAYKEIYYLEDSTFIPVVVATVLANKLAGVPVWLMLIGGSSSGKSEIINAISKVPSVKEISTITPNTFLSGLPNRDGKSSSLLHQIGPRGVIAMKDFTSLLSMRKEASCEIMAQFREIYDGHLDKFTGMGKPLRWEGRLNLIAGVTEKLFVMENQFSGMGTRAINFILPEQDRVKTTKRAAKNEATIDEKRLILQTVFSEYIAEMSEKLVVGEKIILSEEIEDKIIEVCDFSSLARSSVEKDFKGNTTFVLSSEMPMRMSNQLQHLARCFIAMGYEENFEKVLYKIALDCIPKGRRLILRELVGHKSVTIKGLSYKTRYSQDVLSQWMDELYVFHLVDIDRGMGKEVPVWRATSKTRAFMENFENITSNDEDLTEDTGLTDEEIKAKAQTQFDGF